MSKLKNLGVLGYGNMGSAIVRGVIDAKLLNKTQIFVFDPFPPTVESLMSDGFAAALYHLGAYEYSDVIVLAIKPQVFKTQSFADLSIYEGLHKTIISVMAGIRTGQIREVFPKSFTVIRVMPNLSLSVGEGATAIATDGLSEDSILLAEKIFQSSGQTVRVTEEQMDAVTGVSGSGPMYVFEFIEALTQAGIKSGLSREVAYRLAIQTAKGSLKLLETSTDEPSVWSARVRSPGGTTAEAQKVLEQGGFQELMIHAVEAAVKRSKELSN